jgi:hypothetical protein
LLGQPLGAERWGLPTVTRRIRSIPGTISAPARCFTLSPISVSPHLRVFVSFPWLGAFSFTDAKLENQDGDVIELFRIGLMVLDFRKHRPA